MQRRNGFTLIELLVVIAIIGLLSTMAVVSLNSARTKARDAKRKHDLQNIKKALDMYYDSNGTYPPAPCGYDCNGYYYSSDASWATFQTYLAPYLPTLPIDPVNTGGAPWSANGLTYTYGNVGKTTYPAQYDLTGHLESTSDPDRCAVKQYYYWVTKAPWCGGYSSQIIEFSPD